MIKITNFYELDNLLKKKALQKDHITFSFDGRSKGTIVLCSFHIDKYYSTFNDKFSISKTKPEALLYKFVEGVKNKMKIKGFKDNSLLDLEKPLELETKSSLDKKVLTYYKGLYKEDLEDVLKLFHKNTLLFWLSIENYLKDNLWYKGRVQLEEINIKENSVILEGLFRKAKPSSYEQYAADNYPNDESEIKLSAKDLFSILKADVKEVTSLVKDKILEKIQEDIDDTSKKESIRTVSRNIYKKINALKTPIELKKEKRRINKKIELNKGTASEVAELIVYKNYLDKVEMI